MWFGLLLPIIPCTTKGSSHIFSVLTFKLGCCQKLDFFFYRESIIVESFCTKQKLLFLFIYPYYIFLTIVRTVNLNMNSFCIVNLQTINVHL